jgi:hypothetical protein
MVAFECDLCIFRELYRHNLILTDEDAVDAIIKLDVFWEWNGYYPTLSQENDRKATTTITQMILDAFWSQASSTV